MRNAIITEVFHHFDNIRWDWVCAHIIIWLYHKAKANDWKVCAESIYIADHMLKLLQTKGQFNWFDYDYFINKLFQHPVYVQHSRWTNRLQYTSDAYVNDWPTQMRPYYWNRCDNICRRNPEAHQSQTESIVWSIFVINCRLNSGKLMCDIWSTGCYLSGMWWERLCWPTDGAVDTYTWWEFRNRSLDWNWMRLRRTAVRWMWFVVVPVALSIVRCLAAATKPTNVCTHKKMHIANKLLNDEKCMTT